MLESATLNKLSSYLFDATLKVIRENFYIDSDPDITVLKDQHYENCDQLVMITLCSFDFKCLAMLHFPNTTEFKQQLVLFPDKNIHSEAELTRLAIDKLGELCNGIAGFMKKKLEHSFANVGISTPQLLNHFSLDVLLQKTPDYLLNLKVQLDSKQTMIVSFIVFLDKNCHFKLNSHPPKVEVVEEGDVILF